MRSGPIAAGVLVFAFVVACINFSVARQSEPAKPAAQDSTNGSSTAQNSPGSATDSKSSCTTPGQFTVEPAEARIVPGGTLTFTASAPKDCAVPALNWSIDAGFDTSLVEINPKKTSVGSDSADLTLKGTRTALAKAIQADRTKAYIHVTASASDESKNPQVATARVLITTEPAGNIVIPIIGFEQAGASAAQSSQKFFFNLFINRPLPYGEDQILADGTNLGTRYRWFGNVRIASYPQQITSGVAEFAAGFASQVAKLKVNQLAQAGEFNMGLDWRLHSAPWGLYSLGSSTIKEYTLVSLVAGFGAISPLNPVESLQIFATPPVGSPQRTPFLSQFPSSANSTYTGFTTPDRGRFYWEYGAGLRLTTLYFDKSDVQGVTPAMLTYSLGQNQVVSGGVSSGVVQRVEGFFPLPLGDRFAKTITTLYLFGRVDMRVARGKQSTPFILQPAPAGVNGFDSDVNIVTVRQNRDLYTIGVGVDAIKLIKTISLQNKNKTTSGASAMTAASGGH